MKKKTAIYCRTIEEYNIVAKHYNRSAKEYFTTRGWSCIDTDSPCCSHSLKSDSRYDDIPFDEWILTEMPRVGDKVIIIKSDLDWVMQMDKHIGKIVTVTSAEEPYIQFDDSNGWTWDFSKNHFRIATPEEEYDAQFKGKDSCLFVKGQWYKGNNNTYMKFSHLENRSSYNLLYYTEKIRDGHYELFSDFWASNDMEKHALEYPLEKVMDEIQPFLPEGHEDKVVENSPKELVYVAGKWYKMNNCWYAKCSKDSFDEEEFYGNESYNSDGKQDDFEFITTLKEQNSIVELTESIIDHKTPIQLKTIICGDMKNDKKPEPKYKVGDELESCKGGRQFTEYGLENPAALSCESYSNSVVGKCTKIEWSNKHKTWWYKIGDYGNMFTESGVKLVDKMKSIEPEYSKYTIILNSQEEYEQCLDYFENILKISNVDRNLGFTPNWNKFKYDELRKLWRLHGYDDTREYIVSFQDFINNITKNSYKLIPKFSKGDKVKICSSEEDADKDGFMYSTGSTEQISGVAGSIITLTGEIKEKNGNIYYNYKESFDRYIKESCLSLVENETTSKNNAMSLKQEDKITEYKGYKIGDAVIVKNKPIYWSSVLNNNCPLYGKYPIVGIIKDIKYREDDGQGHYAMDMGGYGWSLSHLIDTNNISKIEDLTEYAGLKVGDILKESDINEWRKIGENYKFGGVWEKSSSIFHGDRKIKSFKLINGIVGFKVSGTTNVYLRADGYSDFIKNKNTEKDDSSLKIRPISANVSTNKSGNGIIFIPFDCPFKEGDSVSCIIGGTIVEDGKIHFEDGNIYICQNKKDGSACKNKLGYLYSWIIYSSKDDETYINGLKSSYIENLKLKEVLNDIKEEDYYQKTLNLLKKQITII